MSAPTPCVLISLVVVRNAAKTKFVSTNEKDGWYLPAGRVDSGETFATGATREATEEAGAKVFLEGLLRFEHGPGKRSRFRAVYVGRLEDESVPLKTEPDDETYGAEWLTLKQVEAKGEASELRALEVLNAFKWVSDGTRIHPLSVLRGNDGRDIDSEQVITHLALSTEVVVVNSKREFLLVPARAAVDGTDREESKEADALSFLWGRVNEPATTFAKNAIAMVSQNSSLKDITLAGILRIDHAPPKVAGATGALRVCFLATVDEGLGKGAELPKGGVWMSQGEVASRADGGGADQHHEDLEGPSSLRRMCELVGIVYGSGDPNSPSTQGFAQPAFGPDVCSLDLLTLEGFPFEPIAGEPSTSPKADKSGALGKFFKSVFSSFGRGGK